MVSGPLATLAPSEIAVLFAIHALARTRVEELRTDQTMMPQSFSSSSVSDRPLSDGQTRPHYCGRRCSFEACSPAMKSVLSKWLLQMLLRNPSDAHTDDTMTHTSTSSFSSSSSSSSLGTTIDSDYLLHYRLEHPNQQHHAENSEEEEEESRGHQQRNLSPSTLVRANPALAKFVQLLFIIALTNNAAVLLEPNTSPSAEEEVYKREGGCGDHTKSIQKQSRFLHQTRSVPLMPKTSDINLTSSRNSANINTSRKSNNNNNNHAGATAATSSSSDASIAREILRSLEAVMTTASTDLTTLYQRMYSSQEFAFGLVPPASEVLDRVGAARRRGMVHEKGVDDEDTALINDAAENETDDPSCPSRIGNGKRVKEQKQPQQRSTVVLPLPASIQTLLRQTCLPLDCLLVRFSRLMRVKWEAAPHNQRIEALAMVRLWSATHESLLLEAKRRAITFYSQHVTYNSNKTMPHSSRSGSSVAAGFGAHCTKGLLSSRASSFFGSRRPMRQKRPQSRAASGVSGSWRSVTGDDHSVGGTGRKAVTQRTSSSSPPSLALTSHQTRMRDEKDAAASATVVAGINVLKTNAVESSSNHNYCGGVDNNSINIIKSIRGSGVHEIAGGPSEEEEEEEAGVVASSSAGNAVVTFLPLDRDKHHYNTLSDPQLPVVKKPSSLISPPRSFEGTSDVANTTTSILPSILAAEEKSVSSPPMSFSVDATSGGARGRVGGGSGVVDVDEHLPNVSRATRNITTDDDNSRPLGSNRPHSYQRRPHHRNDHDHNQHQKMLVKTVHNSVIDRILLSESFESDIAHAKAVALQANMVLHEPTAVYELSQPFSDHATAGMARLASHMLRGGDVRRGGQGQGQANGQKDQVDGVNGVHPKAAATIAELIVNTTHHAASGALVVAISHLQHYTCLLSAGEWVSAAVEIGTALHATRRYESVMLSDLLLSSSAPSSLPNGSSDDAGDGAGTTNSGGGGGGGSLSTASAIHQLRLCLQTRVTAILAIAELLVTCPAVVLDSLSLLLVSILQEASVVCGGGINLANGAACGGGGGVDFSSPASSFFGGGLAAFGGGIGGESSGAGTGGGGGGTSSSSTSFSTVTMGSDADGVGPLFQSAMFGGLSASLRAHADVAAAVSQLQGAGGVTAGGAASGNIAAAALGGGVTGGGRGGPSVFAGGFGGRGGASFSASLQLTIMSLVRLSRVLAAAAPFCSDGRSFCMMSNGTVARSEDTVSFGYFRRSIYILSQSIITRSSAFYRHANANTSSSQLLLIRSSSVSSGDKGTTTTTIPNCLLRGATDERLDTEVPLQLSISEGMIINAFLPYYSYSYRHTTLPWVGHHPKPLREAHSRLMGEAWATMFVADALTVVGCFFGANGGGGGGGGQLRTKSLMELLCTARDLFSTLLSHSSLASSSFPFPLSQALATEIKASAWVIIASLLEERGCRAAAAEAAYSALVSLGLSKVFATSSVLSSGDCAQNKDKTLSTRCEKWIASFANGKGSTFRAAAAAGRAFPSAPFIRKRSRDVEGARQGQGQHSVFSSFLPRSASRKQESPARSQRRAEQQDEDDAAETGMARLSRDMRLLGEHFHYEARKRREPYTTLRRQEEEVSAVEAAAEAEGGGAREGEEIVEEAVQEDVSSVQPFPLFSFPTNGFSSISTSFAKTTTTRQHSDAIDRKRREEEGIPSRLRSSRLSSAWWALSNQSDLNSSQNTSNNSKNFTRGAAGANNAMNNSFTAYCDDGYDHDDANSNEDYERVTMLPPPSPHPAEWLRHALSSSDISLTPSSVSLMVTALSIVARCGGTNSTSSSARSGGSDIISGRQQRSSSHLRGDNGASTNYAALSPTVEVREGATTLLHFIGLSFHMPLALFASIISRLNKLAEQGAEQMSGTTSSAGHLYFAPSAFTSSSALALVRSAEELLRIAVSSGMSSSGQSLNGGSSSALQALVLALLPILWRNPAAAVAILEASGRGGTAFSSYSSLSSSATGAHSLCCDSDNAAISSTSCNPRGAAPPPSTQRQAEVLLTASAYRPLSILSLYYSTSASGSGSMPSGGGGGSGGPNALPTIIAASSCTAAATRKKKGAIEEMTAGSSGHDIVPATTPFTLINTFIEERILLAFLLAGGCGGDAAPLQQRGPNSSSRSSPTPLGSPLARLLLSWKRQEHKEKQHTSQDFLLQTTAMEWSFSGAERRLGLSLLVLNPSRASFLPSSSSSTSATVTSPPPFTILTEKIAATADQLGALVCTVAKLKNEQRLRQQQHQLQPQSSERSEEARNKETATESEKKEAAVTARGRTILRLASRLQQLSDLASKRNDLPPSSVPLSFVGKTFAEICEDSIRAVALLTVAEEQCAE